MTSTDQGAPTYPTARDARCPFDPPAGLYELREDGPIHQTQIWNGESVWLVTDYDAIRDTLLNDGLSSDRRRPGFPEAGPSVMASHQGVRMLTSMDPPEHTAVRRALNPEFIIRRISALRPSIQALAEQLCDRLLDLAQPADFVDNFSLALPSLVIAELLGVPPEARPYFEGLSEKMVSSDSSPEQSSEATAEVTQYVAGLLDAKRDDPADDVLSRLAARWAAGDLTRDQAVGAGFILLVGGHETTANMISLSVATLLQHPDQLAELRATEDPALIANAVEELLRYHHIIQYGRRRVATADLEVAGQTVRAGEALVLQGNIADRDPRFFEGDPDVFDIHRPAKHHVAFGFGMHQCLGQPLARAELQIVLGTLFRRIPTLALAVTPAEISFKTGHISGIRHLPVRW